LTIRPVPSPNRIVFDFDLRKEHGYRIHKDSTL
jgi:hypothetical protein